MNGGVVDLQMVKYFSRCSTSFLILPSIHSSSLHTPYNQQQHLSLLLSCIGTPSRLYYNTLGGARSMSTNASTSSSSGGSAHHQHTNRLAKEKSPYLLQHAHNPVDWFPWGEEAFNIARSNDKPIFLSVGYSTCHWCHVMEEESFENEEVAKLMNKEFVSIKVDREERPDIDRCYMTYVQASTGSGGWPMSVWLTPTLKPILGATYFPPTDKYGRPGFATICRRVADLWRTQRASMEEQAAHTTNMLNQLQNPDDETMRFSANDLSPDVITKCYQQIEKGYDTKLGGFTKAPKFPRPVIFSLLFRVFAREQRSTDAAHNEMGTHARDMALFTLQKMAEGGIYDHIGGGFHRYSVTPEWHIPHFEKMLYDQGQLASTYVDAYLISQNPLFKRVAKGVLSYVSTYLTHKDGGFFSAEDADSLVAHHSREKKEGAFYAWTKREIDDVLSAGGDVKMADVFCYYYGVKADGNAPVGGDPHGEFTGKNVLIQRHTIEETAAHFTIDSLQINEMLAAARTRLLEVRNARPRPHLDDKIITAWNGLMISAYTKAYAVFRNEAYLRAATRAADFIYSNLYNRASNTLLRTFREGASNISGFADDYSFLIQALIDLYEATFNIKWLKWTVELQMKHDELFHDRTNAGYYAVAGNDPNLLMRLKEDHDGAEPSSQSVAVMNLLRLAYIAGPEKGEAKVWLDRAEKTFLALPSLLESPIVMPYMVCALDMMVTPSLLHAVILGRADREDTQSLLQAVHSIYRPNRVAILADRAEGEAFLVSIGSGLAFLKEADMIKDQATAFICENHACRLPTTNPKAVVDMLRT